MRINKLIVLLFIFSLAMVLFPASSGIGSYEQPIRGPTDLVTDQNRVAPLKGIDLNASISNVNRNITILLNALVSLEDEVTLKIHDNQTQISHLNYTLPSVFADNIQQLTVYSQFDTLLGLEDDANKKSYTTFSGYEETTYSIDISQNGTLANGTLDAVNIRIQAVAMNIIDFTLNGTGQRGVFQAPILPMFVNLPVENAAVDIRVPTTQDEFRNAEVPQFKNKIGADMPRVADNRHSLTYVNVSREAYIPYAPLGKYDVGKMVFVSSTPIGETQSAPTAVVPSAFKEADRVVAIDPWGKVRIKETLTVIHLGGGRNATDNIFYNVHQIPSQLFTIDDKAVITDVYDNFGSLNLRNRDKNTNYPQSTGSGIPGKQSLRVDFRNPIYGGQTYTFSIEYEYNISQVVSSSGNVHTFNATLFSDFNTTVWDMNVKYQLPAGSTFLSHTYYTRSSMVSANEDVFAQRPTLSSLRVVTLEFNMENASYIDNHEFTISYRFTGISYFDYIITFFTITVLLLSLVYLISGLDLSSKEQRQVEREQIPVDEIESFFNIFSEIVGAEKRMAQLRDRRKKGKISQKDYSGQVKAIQRRIRDRTPELETAANELSSKGGRYENFVNKIMIANQRQIDARRNSRVTRQRYTRGEIPKNVYQKLIREYNQDMSKQESTINKNLTELYEIATKYRS